MANDESLFSALDRVTKVIGEKNYQQRKAKRQQKTDKMRKGESIL